MSGMQALDLSLYCVVIGQSAEKSAAHLKQMPNERQRVLAVAYA